MRTVVKYTLLVYGFIFSIITWLPNYTKYIEKWQIALLIILSFGLYAIIVGIEGIIKNTKK